MFTIPSRSSDAGPLSRRINREETPFDCCNCGTPIHQHDSWRCQGSDTCMARMCEGCKQSCYGCGLPACSDHLGNWSGEKMCVICVGEVVDGLAEAEARGGVLSAVIS